MGNKNAQIILAKSDSSESQRELKHRELARSAATEGIVLLKNDGGMPVKVGKLALFGAGGVKTVKGGTGSGEVNERYSVTIYEGLKNAGYDIVSKSWIDDYVAEYDAAVAAYEKKALQAFKRLKIKSLIGLFTTPFSPPIGRLITQADLDECDTDTAVYVVSRQAGEGSDRHIEKGHNDLYEAEIDNLKLLTKGFKKVILVINVGCSMDMAFLDKIDGINSVVYFCQQGEEGGNAFADILSGKVSPSGRLTSTWAVKYEDLPYANEYSYLNGNLDEEYYKEDIYVGYRYFDTFKVAPKYEFGYGLSYSDTKLDVESVALDGTDVVATVKVNNVGKYPTKEVVQLYVSAPRGTLDKEYQRLAAFAKTDVIPPKKSQSITLKFDIGSCASYFEDRQAFVLEAGEYILRIGHSSRKNEVAAVIELDADATVSQHKNLFPVPSEFPRLKSENVDLGEIPEGAVRLALSASDIATRTYNYEQPPVYSDEKVNALMSKLSPKEKARVVVGAGMKLGGKFSGSKFTVPGAVGYTTDQLFDKGLINVVLSDGPAGLRIAKTAGIDKNGISKNAKMMFDFLDFAPNFIKKILCADMDKCTPVYQYCTAFPVALALAQSWNETLLTEIGTAIGLEMDEFGVTYWLAPGMNIHRNPLCGRNFEYYSEDPLLSGKMAAATSRGVQSFDGQYVTIKHFCCNNQEENRNHTNANVYERALREIYLSGFGIAVQEGGAKSIMTSYNKMNGTYTANSRELCTLLTRCEWGFDGVIMTDWLSSGGSKADTARCISVGNDLIMPGGGSYLKAVVKGVKKGTITPEQLNFCCANIVRSILYANVALSDRVKP